MKKPEKKEYSGLNGGVEMPKDLAKLGYNQACNDWEKFLPSEEEIVEVIEKTIKEQQILHIDKPTNYQAWRRLAKAISKRIRGEK